MQVSGVNLKYAMNSQKKKNDLLYSKFKKNIKRFPSDTSTDTLPAIAKQIEAGEARVAKIQTYLTEYNSKVTFEYNGESISLLEAIRRVGAANRVEKVWGDILKEKGGRYGYSSDSRDKDHEYATPTLSDEEVTLFHEEASSKAAKLRSLIEISNAHFIELPGVESVLEEKTVVPVSG